MIKAGQLEIMIADKLMKAGAESEPLLVACFDFGRLPGTRDYGLLHTVVMNAQYRQS